MDIYERHDYLGGRSTVVTVKDDPALGVIELGASIFIEDNYNLMNATEKFGLKLKVLTEDDNGRGLGLWNGEEFIFEETGNYYWDVAKIIWRYGLSPMKLKRLVPIIIENFKAIYDNDATPFRDIPTVLERLNMEHLINATAAEYLEDGQNFDQRFVREIVQTATRANYGQDVHLLHAFGALVSMAAAKGAWSVQGGNFLIFEEFVRRANAELHLQTSVTSIQNVTDVDEHGLPVRRYIVTTANDESELYDAVILATPLHNAQIELPFANTDTHRTYHTVHVTLVAGVPNPGYFNRDKDTIPSFIVTTGHFETENPPFTTFVVHRTIETGESVVKMFSSKQMTDDELDKLFYDRSWVYRHRWEAFPKLFPVTLKENTPDTWPSFVLDGFQEETGSSEHGIVYVNAFENVISTMETQTIAAKNAVKLIHGRWCGHSSSLKRGCVAFGDGWGGL
ncbi:Prenylcysteine lyase [Radiomyces spectabilis]|uniref:Prenylcysteine lyase n=1 Tax=Radiomyces spectabilis TaxID=64574 RepID=UPI0022201388|nr:Prenylcysteine lyase [Radiomyces spectabilis]KAI8368233.1 Prenylcysteine lyase [Radiomyces spectabilis]